MNIQLGTITDANNKVSKSFSPSLTLTGTLRAPSDIIDPVITIESESVPNYNYAYIPEFSRYYYIDNITSIVNNIWQLSMHVDVLNTYSVQIKSLNALISDVETDGKNISEPYLASDTYKSKVKVLTDIINFPSGVSDSGEFILITVGG